MGKKNWAKHDLERDRLMQMVPVELPPAVDRFLVEVCLANHHYMFYDNSRGFSYRYCTRCQRLIDNRWILQPQHNKPITCPQCNTEVTGVCVGRYKHNELKSDNFNVRIMQRTPEGIVIRLFGIIRRCHNWRGTIKEEWLWDEMQRIFNDGTIVRRYKRVYGYGPEGAYPFWNESKQINFATHNYMGWVTDNEEYDFIEGVRDIIAGTCWQYSHLAKVDEFQTRGGVLDYLSAWIKPVEYLEKTGWSALAHDILNFDTRFLKPTARTINEFLRLPKQQIAYARKANLDTLELEALRTIIRAKEPIPAPYDFKRFSDHREYYRVCHALAPTMRIAEWLRYEPALSHYHLYHDYLRFCRDLGYDMADRAVLFPKDIRQAHDREMVRVKVMAKEKENEAIAKRYQRDLTQHGFHIAGLLIRPPVDAEELIREGAKLHHCVGTYVDQVAKDKTTILLVRRKDKPDEPYFTAEWREGHLTQIRGDHNKPPTPEVAEFIKAWEARKKKTPKTKQIAVMAAAAI